MPYNVWITLQGWKRRRPDIILLGKDAAWVEEQIAAPRRQGRDIFLKGQVLAWTEIEQIRIIETDEVAADRLARIDATEADIEAALLQYGSDVTEQFLTGTPGTSTVDDSTNAADFADNRKAVMVIYGHDTQANIAMFDWLRAVGLQPKEWAQLIQASGSGSPYIGQVLDRAFQDAQAVVAFFTPDEYVTPRAGGAESQSSTRLQARPNVLIEAGMALITHPDRTIIVVLGTQELPSDVVGRHYVRLSPTDPAPLNDLIGRLRRAGCDVDNTGVDWLNPTRFPDREYPASPQQDQAHTSVQTESAAVSAGAPLQWSAIERSGKGSRVIEIDLNLGRYRLSWNAKGHGPFVIKHEGEDDGDYVVMKYLNQSDSGEDIIRITDAGRQLFNIQAPDMSWSVNVIQI